MSLIISATLGRLSPRFRTVHEFIPIFRGTLTARELSEKTLANHDTALRQLDAAIGSNMIGFTRPHEIATPTRAMHAQHPHAAQRLLAEARALFAEAVALGWSDCNPAAEVKMPVARIARERLSLDQWRQIAAYARDKMPPCLAECRSLAERLYSAQGIDTQTLLGHTRYKMTELYHNDRGLSAGQWKTVKI